MTRVVVFTTPTRAHAARRLAFSEVPGPNQPRYLGCYIAARRSTAWFTPPMPAVLSHHSAPMKPVAAFTATTARFFAAWAAKHGSSERDGFHAASRAM